MASLSLSASTTKKKNKLCVRNQARFKKSFLLSREKTMLKKALELSILCDNEICVLHYDREGNLVNTLPEDQSQVKDILERYNNLSEGEKIKKNTNLSRFLNKKLMGEKERSVTNAEEGKKFRERIGEFKGSLVDQLLVFQDRVRFYSQETKQDESPCLDASSGFVLPNDLSSSMSVCLPDRQSKFSVFLFNHETSTLTQLPNSVSSSFDQQSQVFNNTLNTPGFNFGCNNSLNTLGFNFGNDNSLNTLGFNFGNDNSFNTLGFNSGYDNSLNTLGFNSGCNNSFNTHGFNFGYDNNNNLCT